MELQDSTQLLGLLSDTTRLRLLALLERSDASVRELTAATALPQPRVSTHLGKLREAGLVCRVEGRYRAQLSRIGALWSALREELGDPLLAEDTLRLTRAQQGESWADTVAGQMARHYSPGRTWSAMSRGLAGLGRLGRVLDVASGDGALAELIAPIAEEVVCLDRSEKVVAAGAARLSEHNVSFVCGDMHALPFDDDRFDHVLLLAALPYATDPALVASECARVLAPGGTLTAVTLSRHRHQDFVAPYGHVNRGFSIEDLTGLFEKAGLIVRSCLLTSRERKPPHFEVLTLYADAGVVS